MLSIAGSLLMIAISVKMGVMDIEKFEKQREYLTANYPTLRDSFALSALSGLITQAKELDVKYLVKKSYQIADAMLKARTAIVLLVLFVVGCGETGPQGIAGPAGPSGVSGNSAEPCTVSQVGVSVAAPSGGAVISCSGSSALILNGEKGSAGTVVSPVQLCPSSFVAVYPSVFPEIAFRIDGKLYAVYSANGGFLVELTPGSYSSNGINASCTFVVGNDGDIL